MKSLVIGAALAIYVVACWHMVAILDWIFASGVHP